MADLNVQQTVNQAGGNTPASSDTQTPLSVTPAPAPQPVSSDAPVSNGTPDTNPEDLSEQWRRYKCLVCGLVAEGRGQVKKCKRCGNEDADKFSEAD